MRLVLGFSLVLLLTACASSTMKSYIGKPVQEIAVDYGPPTNAFDMGDGRRAFQWERRTSYQTPTQVRSNAYVTGYGNAAWVNSNTTISGGQLLQGACIYTLFGRWNGQAWIISDFRKPPLMCE
jgi:hypothetical protein